MEDYFFDIKDEYTDDRLFVLIIYDIIDNKKRTKFSKLLLGYGFRVQKSAFEAVISKSKYKELLSKIPEYITKDDSVKVYKIIGKGQVTTFGIKENNMLDDVIVM